MEARPDHEKPCPAYQLRMAVSLDHGGEGCFQWKTEADEESEVAANPKAGKDCGCQGQPDKAGVKFSVLLLRSSNRRCFVFCHESTPQVARLCPSHGGPTPSIRIEDFLESGAHAIVKRKAMQRVQAFRG